MFSLSDNHVPIKDKPHLFRMFFSCLFLLFSISLISPPVSAGWSNFKTLISSAQFHDFLKSADNREKLISELKSKNALKDAEDLNECLRRCAKSFGLREKLLKTGKKNREANFKTLLLHATTPYTNNSDSSNIISFFTALSEEINLAGWSGLILEYCNKQLPPAIATTPIPPEHITAALSTGDPSHTQTTSAYPPPAYPYPQGGAYDYQSQPVAAYSQPPQADYPPQQQQYGYPPQQQYGYYPPQQYSYSPQQYGYTPQQQPGRVPPQPSSYQPEKQPFAVGTATAPPPAPSQTPPTLSTAPEPSNTQSNSNAPAVTGLMQQVTISSNSAFEHQQAVTGSTTVYDINDIFEALSQHYQSFLTSIWPSTPDPQTILNGFMAAKLYSKQQEAPFASINIKDIAANIIKDTTMLSGVTLPDDLPKTTLGRILGKLFSSQERGVFIIRVVMLTADIPSRTDSFANAVRTWMSTHQISFTVNTNGEDKRCMSLPDMHKVWRGIQCYESAQLEKMVNGCITKQLEHANFIKHAQLVQMNQTLLPEFEKAVFSTTNSFHLPTLKNCFDAATTNKGSYRHAKVLFHIAKRMLTTSPTLITGQMSALRQEFAGDSATAQEYITHESDFHLRSMIETFEPADQLAVIIYSLGKLHPQSKRLEGVSSPDTYVPDTGSTTSHPPGHRLQPRPQPQSTYHTPPKTAASGMPHNSGAAFVKLADDEKLRLYSQISDGLSNDDLKRLINRAGIPPARKKEMKSGSDVINYLEGNKKIRNLPEYLDQIELKTLGDLARQVVVLLPAEIPHYDTCANPHATLRSIMQGDPPVALSELYPAIDPAKALSADDRERILTAAKKGSATWKRECEAVELVIRTCKIPKDVSKNTKTLIGCFRYLEHTGWTSSRIRSVFAHIGIQF